MGTRPTARPVVRASNEDETEVTLMDLEGLMDSESDDGAEAASEGNSVHASKQGNSLDTAAPRGSPPKPSQNRERGDAKPSKRMKLPDEKKRSSYGDASLKSLEAQTASAERA